MLSILENSPTTISPQTKPAPVSTSAAKAATPAPAASPVTIAVHTSPAATTGATAAPTTPTTTGTTPTAAAATTPTTDAPATTPDAEKKPDPDRYSKLARYVAMFGGGLAAGGLLHALSNHDIGDTSGTLAADAGDHHDAPAKEPEPAAEKPAPIPPKAPVDVPQRSVVYNTTIYGHPYGYEQPQYALMHSQPAYAANHLAPGNPAVMVGRGTPYDNIYSHRTHSIPVPVGSSGRLWGWGRIR